MGNAISKHSLASDILSKVRWFFFVFSALIFTAVFFTDSLHLILAGLLGLAIVAWAAFSVERFFLMVLLYIYFLPNYSAYERYSFFPYYARTDLLIMSLAFFALIWWIGKLYDQWPPHKSSSFDLFLFGLLIWTCFMFLWGNANGHSLKASTTDAILLSLFFAYFPIRFMNITVPSLHRMWLILSWAAVFVSIEYAFLTFSEEGIADMIIRRVSTQQPHVAQLALPYFFGFFFFPNSLRKRLLAFAAILILFSMVFLSQQRALWVTSVFSIFLFWGISQIRKGIGLQQILRFAGFFFSALLLIALLLFLIDRFYAGNALATFLWRISSFENLARDESLIIRITEIKRALSQWSNNIFFGTGLGATIEPITLKHWSPYLVDNSYAYVLWKMGIIGLILFSAVIMIPLYRGMRLFVRLKNANNAHLIGALLSGWIGLLIIALTNTCLVRYFYIILWAFLFATIEIMNEKTLHEKS